MATRVEINMCLHNLQRIAHDRGALEESLNAAKIQSLLQQDVHHDKTLGVYMKRPDRISGRPHNLQAQRSWMEGANTAARRP